MLLGVPMLLPQAILCACLECTCDITDAPTPVPQISWEAPVEKKAECIQKGKSNQVGAQGQGGQAGLWFFPLAGPHGACSLLRSPFLPVLIWVPMPVLVSVFLGPYGLPGSVFLPRRSVSISSASCSRTMHPTCMCVAHMPSSPSAPML